MIDRYAELMRAKLGLQECREGDDKLVTDLLNLMQSSRVDYSRFFRSLCVFRQDSPNANVSLRDQFLHRAGLSKSG